MNAITAIEAIIIMILLIWKLKDSKNKKTWIRNLPEPVVEYVIKEASEPTKEPEKLTPENVYKFVPSDEWDVCAISNYQGRSVMAYNANDKHTYIIDIDYDVKFSWESWARAFDKFARTVNNNFVEVLW